LFFKPIEFDGFKIRIIELLPHSQKLNGISVPQPVANQVVRPLRVLETGDISNADILNIAYRVSGYTLIQHLQLGFHSLKSLLIVDTYALYIR
jgi:hypothetical protein